MKKILISLAMVIVLFLIVVVTYMIWLNNRTHIPWSVAETLFKTCMVKSAGQTHDRAVTFTLKNGWRVNTVEPRLDDLFRLADSIEPTCGKMFIWTE